MKLDLTSVKLRKTGISDQMLMDRSADISKDLPNFAVGAEYDTKHTTMLLQIKGWSNSGLSSISEWPGFGLEMACVWSRSSPGLVLNLVLVCLVSEWPEFGLEMSWVWSQGGLFLFSEWSVFCLLWS